jgi:Protein of unknown function (DUF3300)
MPNCRQALSVFLSFAVTISVIGLDGCKKSESTQPQSNPGQAPATTYAAPTADQLYQLVAPIALFPDNLVAQVLAASTFPDQVSAAYTWLQQNSSLKGQQLLQAVNQQSWDASVKGLTQFPDVLKQMATNLSWTSALGDAYFNIPQSVMNAIQVMRQRAQQSGNLKSTTQQTVTVQNQAPGSAPPPPASSGEPQTTVVVPPPAQTIIIQPAQPDVVYVPVYNPTVVYGAPVAVYPGYSTGDMVATGLISFGLGVAVGAAISGGGGCCGWGWNSWGCGWHNNTVVYNHNTYISNSNTFVNRNNYYGHNNVNVNNYNRNNVNVNNYNRNNVNANNYNRNNINTNNVNRNNLNSNNYRANNFNSSNYTTPHFNQKYDQPQYRNSSNPNLAQNNRQQPNFNQQNRSQQNRQQPNFNQQNRQGSNANQARPNASSQPQRSPERGYGQQPARGTNTGAFSNYSQGGNARTNSARGQQSLEGNRGGGNAGANRGGGFRR